LENSEGLAIQVSLRFNLLTTNKQYEYKACLGRLHLVAEMGPLGIIWFQFASGDFQKSIGNMNLGAQRCKSSTYFS